MQEQVVPLSIVLTLDQIEITSKPSGTLTLRVFGLDSDAEAIGEGIAVGLPSWNKAD